MDPLAGETLLTAVAAHAGADDRRSPEQRRADALVTLARIALDGGKAPVVGGHLVSHHDYTAEQLSGGTKSFLDAMHLRAHQRMAGGAEGTVPELAGSGERLFATALETLEAMLPLDRDLVRQLATRWSEALTVLGR